MECDRAMLPVSVQAAVAMVVAASIAVATGDVHAQPAPDIVVTSPHVWQPGGSAPPYGVQVLPGSSAELTLVFENRGSETVPSYASLLPVDPNQPDVTLRYPTDPSPDPRCGALERIPNNFTYGGGYRYAVGPIGPGTPLTCVWRIRRPADGPDLLLRGPNVQNQFIHVGSIPDIEVRFDQLTPTIAGVSRTTLYRMTVVNPGPVNLTSTPTWGICGENNFAGVRFVPAGPEPCGTGFFVCFGGISSVSVGPVPAGQQRECTFVFQQRQPIRQLGTFPVLGYFSQFASTAAGIVYDPNPSNSSNRPILTVSAEAISAVDFWSALLLALSILLTVAVWHRPPRRASSARPHAGPAPGHRACFT